MPQVKLTSLKTDERGIIPFIKALREISDLGLAEAKNLADALKAGEQGIFTTNCSNAQIVATLRPYCDLSFSEGTTRILLDNPHVGYALVTEEAAKVVDLLSQARDIGVRNIPFTNAETYLPLWLDERIIVGIEPIQ